MHVTTTFAFEGYQIKEYKGLVHGIVVRSPTFLQVVGDQISAFTKMCEEARQQAFRKMLQHAQEAGANAVVGIRYDSAEASSQNSATEFLCYGTAVVIEPLQ